MANELTAIESSLYFMVIFSITLFLCYLSKKGNYITVVFEKNELCRFSLSKITLLLLAAQPLVFMFASRSLSVGTDTLYTYYPYYYQGYCVNGRSYDGIEYGFMMLFRFAYNCSNSFNGCLWIIGEFLLIVYLLILSKIFARDVFLLSVVIFLAYYYFPSFNILRQSFAMMIILLAYENLHHKNYKKFLLNVFFASLFHTSALICTPILVFDIISRKSAIIRKIGLVLIVGTIASFPTIYDILLNSNIFTKLDNYVLTANVPISQMLFVAFKGLLFEIPLIAIFVFLLCKRGKICGWDYTMIAMLLIDCCFWVICSINPVFMRLSYYYQLSFFWVIPRIIELTGEKSFILKIGIIIYIIVRMFLFYFIWGYDSVVPYSFAIL